MLEGGLLKLIEKYKKSRKVLGALNSTFISLGWDPSSLEDFRNVSLCNLVYKLISKIISNKLIGILFGTISSEQFGFLFKRKIQDGVGIA